MRGVAYSAFAYVTFLVSFATMVGFVTGVALPRTVDVGPAVPPSHAVARALGWFLVFGVQHSVMARPAFKRRFARIVPPHVERSTYVLVSALLILLLQFVWRPIPHVLWQIDSPPARYAVYAISAAGWALVVGATFMLDHFEFFGLRQAWSRWRGTAAGASEMRTPSAYRWVRHPLYLGFLVGFWSVPTMTVGHALLAAGFTTYILIGVHFEERDLVRHFGEAYVAYRARVPMLVPWRRPRR